MSHWTSMPTEPMSDDDLKRLDELIFCARNVIDHARPRGGDCAKFMNMMIDTCLWLRRDLIDARNRKTWEGFQDYIKTPAVTDETIRLRAIVERLPVTRDGGRVVPFLDVIWAVENGKVSHRGPGWIWECHTPGYGWGTFYHDESGCSKDWALVSDCYSTRQAAEADLTAGLCGTSMTENIKKG